MSPRLARRSGRATDPLGLLLALACWAAVACYPSTPEPPGVVMRWDQDNTGTYCAGAEAEIVAVVSGVTRCAVQGFDPATCDLSRCWICGERR